MVYAWKATHTTISIGCSSTGLHREKSYSHARSAPLLKLNLQHSKKLLQQLQGSHPGHTGKAHTAVGPWHMYCCSGLRSLSCRRHKETCNIRIEQATSKGEERGCGSVGKKKKEKAKLVTSTAEQVSTSHSCPGQIYVPNRRRRDGRSVNCSA